MAGGRRARLGAQAEEDQAARAPQAVGQPGSAAKVQFAQRLESGVRTVQKVGAAVKVVNDSFAPLQHINGAPSCSVARSTRMRLHRPLLSPSCPTLLEAQSWLTRRLLAASYLGSNRSSSGCGLHTSDRDNTKRGARPLSSQHQTATALTMSCCLPGMQALTYSCFHMVHKTRVPICHYGH